MIGNWRHLCVDMQRVFSEPTPWQVSWMDAVSPQIVEVAQRHSYNTIFTRFLPPVHAEDAPGMWRDYFEKWWMMTREHLPAEMFDLIPQLAVFIPPAAVFDKPTYSPWIDGRLHRALIRDGVETLVITGGETDVCVLTTALGALDLGYRVIILTDAVCSGTDETHDAALALLGRRFSAQIESIRTEKFLSRDPG